MQPSQYQIYSTSKAAWDAMYDAILGAKKSVYWELFIFVDDAAGMRFFDLLEQKAATGVNVKVVVDSLGSFWLSRKRVASLRNAGVDILFFSERKRRFRGWFRRLSARAHRKILIVDEMVGFIGGVNIKKGMEEWLDFQVRIEGKAVHSLLRGFARSYMIAGGDKRQVRHLLQYKFRVAQDIQGLEFIYDNANPHLSLAKKKYTEALLKARERVILFSPYYFPDKQFLEALWKARRRGIRIDLLIPFRTDVRIATYAAYAFFSLMKKMGVQVHLTKHMMHGKGVVVDDEWAMVGSSNIDRLSFHDTYEANVRFTNKKTVQDIKNTVLSWLEFSTPLEEHAWWKARGWWIRLKIKLALKMRKWWNPEK